VTKLQVKAYDDVVFELGITVKIISTIRPLDTPFECVHDEFEAILCTALAYLPGTVTHATGQL
jgi:hypothetical protein